MQSGEECRGTDAQNLTLWKCKIATGCAVGDSTIELTCGSSIHREMIRCIDKL